MNRRGFLGAILAAATAPAIVRADSLMRIVPRETTVLGSPGASEILFWQARQAGKSNPLFDGEIGRYNDIVFYAGHQWTPEQIARMRAAAPLEINRIDWREERHDDRFVITVTASLR